MVIWPEASRAQNSMAAVSAEGSTVWVLMRRLNSSCSRSTALVVRADFHWLTGSRVKGKRRSPASSRLSATGSGFEPTLAQEGFAARLDFLCGLGVYHVLVIVRDLRMQLVRGVG